MTQSRLRLGLLPAALTTVILCAAPAVLSQTSDPAQPRLFGRYTNPGPSCQLSMELDNISGALTAYEDDIAYVIVYRSYNPPGSSPHYRNLTGLFQRHSRAIKNYLLKKKQVSDDRVQIIDGGIIDGGDPFQAEVWLVPKGQSPPQPDQPARPSLQEANKLRLFDEYLYDPDNDMTEYFDPVARLEGFAKTLASEPGTVGYVIGYGKHLDVTEWRLVDGTDEYVAREYQQTDPEGTGKEIAAEEVRGLIELFGINRSRIRAVDGGYRNSQAIELWLVPAGGTAPKATPSALQPAGNK